MTPGNNNSSSTHSEKAGKKKLGQTDWFCESARRTGAARSERVVRGAVRHGYCSQAGAGGGGGEGGGADVSRCSTLTGREKPLLVYRGAA